MGLNEQALKAIKDNLSVKTGLTVSLGYPDILDGARFCRQEFGEVNQRESYRRGMALVDSTWFFKMLGQDLIVLDVAKTEGVERIFDLNLSETPEDLLRAADLVIDPGTIEHLMHPGHGFIHVFRMARKRGLILHYGKLACPEHGFYSINPKLLERFYPKNGCEVRINDKDETHFFFLIMKGSVTEPQIVYDSVKR